MFNIEEMKKKDTGYRKEGEEDQAERDDERKDEMGEEDRE